MFQYHLPFFKTCSINYLLMLLFLSGKMFKLVISEYNIEVLNMSTDIHN